MELFELTCRVINLDRNPERWEICEKRLQAAGFKNYKRVSGVDARNPEELKKEWELWGNPTFAKWDQEFVSYPGKQGCFLSHVKLWKEIVDNKIEKMVILEDDVLFHSDWSNLAPEYLKNTPSDFDVLYLGAQFEFPSTHHIDRGPVFCTHAMVITLAGAEKLLNLVFKHPNGVYTIDCMLIDCMKQYYKNLRLNRNTTLPFKWYVWNGLFYPTEMKDMPKGWTKRNCGLVYQDERFGSEVRPW